MGDAPGIGSVRTAVALNAPRIDRMARNLTPGRGGAGRPAPRPSVEPVTGR